MTTADGGAPGVRPAPEVTVLWAPLLTAAAHVDALVAGDHARWRSLRPADRARFASGRRLLRLAAEQVLGDADDLEWSVVCPLCGSDRHGPPRVRHRSRDGDIAVSLSHTRDLAVVAVVRPAVSIGVDLEPLDPVSGPHLAELVLSEPELAQYRAAPPDNMDGQVRAWWVRKESVLKAAQVGLTVHPDQVQVTPPSTAPALLRWDGAPGDLSRPTLLALEAPGLHAYGCLCLAVEPVSVTVAAAHLG